MRRPGLLAHTYPRQTALELFGTQSEHTQTHTHALCMDLFAYLVRMCEKEFKKSKAFTTNPFSEVLAFGLLWRRKLSATSLKCLQTLMFTPESVYMDAKLIQFEAMRQVNYILSLLVNEFLCGTDIIRI